MPDVKRDEFAPKLIRLTAASLQVPVRCCYSWRIQMMDARRSNVFSMDKSKITGVTLYPLIVPGLTKDLYGIRPTVSRAKSRAVAKADAVVEVGF